MIQTLNQSKNVDEGLMLKKNNFPSYIAGFIISLGRNVLMFLTYFKKLYLLELALLYTIWLVFSLAGRENIMFSAHFNLHL